MFISHWGNTPRALSPKGPTLFGKGRGEPEKRYPLGGHIDA